LGVSGGAQSAWAYLPSSAAERLRNGEGAIAAADGVWRLAIREAETPPKRSLWRRPLWGGSVEGDLRVACVVGESMHAFFADGSHLRYEINGGGAELKLPQDETPVALAADDAKSCFYALVPKRVAIALVAKSESESDSLRAKQDSSSYAVKPEANPSKPQEVGNRPDVADIQNGTPTENLISAAEAPSEAPSDGESNAMRDRWPGSAWVILRFERARWFADRAAPGNLNGHERVWMTAHDGAIRMFTVDGDGGAVLTSVSASDVSEWTPAAPIDLAPVDRVVDIISLGSTPVIVTKGPDSDGYKPMALKDDGWSSGGLLEDGKGTPLHTKWDARFAVRDKRLIGVWRAGQRTITFAEWEIGGGAPVDGPAPIDVFSTRYAPPGERNWRQELVGYALLMVVLVVVFVRRRAAMIQGANLKPHQRLVGHGKRLGAFLIDAAILAPGVYIGALRPIMNLWDPTMDIDSQLAVISEDARRDMLARYLAVLGSFMVYAIIFESWWRATPGKRLLGLMVADENGERPRFFAVFLRNVFRCIEFFPGVSLLPTLVLVLITRNRQRFGDMIAGTVVIEEFNPSQATKVVV
jgi:uncharacterized RDD family membrane protein YckC